MIILSSIGIILWIILIVAKASYLWELAVSFLPYIGLIYFLGLLYRIYRLRKQLYKRTWKKRSWLSSVFILGFWSLFLLLSGEVQDFYHQDITHSEKLTAPIRVLFSNIYEGNSNFEGIKQTITKENPDIIMFVEFSDQHKQGLQEFLDARYPYMNTTTRSKIFVGSVVFSKFPITNLADDFEQGSWRYGYFKIEKEHQPYYFYEIHTASPVSKAFFQKRNEQLQQIKSEFLKVHPSSREHQAKIVMVGDFNMSPRSAYYKDFAQSLSGTLNNATRSFPLLFTRSLSEMLQVHHDFEFLPLWVRKTAGALPILWSHIDQLFISPNVKIQNLKSIQIPWSDHRGFVFDIE